MISNMTILIDVGIIESVSIYYSYEEITTPYRLFQWNRIMMN